MASGRTPASAALPRNRPRGSPAPFPAVKQSFPAADYAAATGTLVFDIGGNKYRRIARVDFEERPLSIQEILRREQYGRKNV